MWWRKTSSNVVALIRNELASDDNDFGDSTDGGFEDVGINSNIQVQSQQDWEISTSTKVKREGMSTIE